MSERPKALFIYGVNDHSTSKVRNDHNGQLQIILDGGSNVCDFLPSQEIDKSRVTLVPTREQNLKLVKPDIIFNEISSPETHGRTIKASYTVLERLSEKPVINHPDKINQTKRHHIYELLHEIPGLYCPKTIMVTPQTRDELASYVLEQFADQEVIIRESGTHGGETMLRWQPQRPVSELDIFSIDGKRSFYISEYVDTALSDGLYRKYRIAVVDGVPFIRHLLIHEHWMVHASARRFMHTRKDLRQEEIDCLVRFPTDLKCKIAEVVEAIYLALGLDYFGIDFAINNQEQMVIFEVNANMNMLINTEATPNVWEAPIAKIVEAITTMIKQRVAHANLH